MAAWDFSPSNIVYLVFRTLQLITALVVIGLYGVDLNRAQKEHKYSDSKWVYAVAIGSLSAVSAVAISFASVCLTLSVAVFSFVWDFILVILWAAVAGIFGSMYLHEKTEMESGIHRMKVAVGFDLTCMVLWFLTAAIGLLVFLMGERRSLHTGQAKVSYVK